MTYSPTYINFVFLSYAKDQSFWNMTQEAIDSLLASEPDWFDIEFNIVVVETNNNAKSFEGANVVTLFPYKPFNYNEFMNIGIKYHKENNPNAEFIALCNNDLVFHKDWLTNIIKAMRESDLDSASPLSPNWEYHRQTLRDNPGQDVLPGFHIGWNFAGWCLTYKTEALDKLYPLDEELVFWCQDNLMSFIGQKLGMKHALVTTSKVTHLGSKSHKLIPSGKQHEFTHGMGEVFARKAAEYEREMGS